MTAFGPRAGGLRLIRIALVAIGVGVMLNTCGVVMTFFLNADRVAQINQERFENTRRNCEDVNRRHDRAVRTVSEILGPRLLNAKPAERARLEASRETTVLLIEALTPKRDCARVARELVQTP